MKSRLFKAFLLVAMLAALVSVFAAATYAIETAEVTETERTVTVSGTCGADGDNLAWTLYDDGELLIVGYGAMEDFTRSSVVPWNSYRADIKKITIETGVTNIGDYAFFNCYLLESIVMSEGLTSIGDGAFSYCFELASIDMPASLMSIGNNAFWGCSSLVSIDIPESVTSIGEDAFGGSCRKLTAIEVADANTVYTDVDGILFTKDMKTIVAYPSGKTATSYEIPESVTNIGSYAFTYCNSLTNIVIHEAVTGIGNSAFRGCKNLASFDVADSNTVYADDNGILYTKDMGTLVKYPAGKIETSYEIPECVTIIGNGAFDHSTNLTSVAIHEGVTNIGYLVFDYCSSLTSVTVYSKTVEFVRSVFLNCPDTLTIYGYEGSTAQIYATANGHNFVALVERTVTASGTCGAEGDNLTWTLYNDGELVISGSGKMKTFSPSTSNAAPWYSKRSSIKSVVIEEGVASIGAYAFNVCINIKTISIPASVATIDPTFIFGASNLTSIEVAAESTVYSSVDGILFNADKTQLVHYTAGKTDTSYTVPSTVKSIESYAFEYAKKLAEITIPEGVLSIGSHAFQNCSSIAQFDLPDSLTTIGTYAFTGCAKLTKIVIPKNVKSIGASAFQNCKAIAAFTVDAENEYYVSVDGVLYDINKTTLVAYPPANAATEYVVPDTVTSIYAYAFSYSVNLLTVELPDTLKTIGIGAFQNCTALTSINLPSGLTTIINSLFSGCKALAEIVIPEGVKSISASVFNNCTSLASVSLPSTLNTIGTRVFYGCSSLTEISIPGSVTSIAANAFQNCSALVKAVVYNESTTFSTNVFNGTSAEFTLYGHTGSTAETYAKANSHNFVSVNIKFLSASLSLYNDISVNFKANKTAMDAAGITEPYAVFEFGGNKYTVTDYTVETMMLNGEDIEVYVFAFKHLAPDRMNDTITATLHASFGGQDIASSSVTYSVAKYCYNQLKKLTFKTELGTMCVDLLNYGAATQEYTGHNIDALANADLTDEQKAWGTQDDREFTNVTARENAPAVESAYWKSASLKLKENITVEMKFQTDDISGLYVEIEMYGRTYRVDEFGYDSVNNFYVVEFDKFSAMHMSEVIKATVRDAEGNAVSKVLTYSVESYAYSKKDIDGIGKLVRAMMKYGDSAIAYDTSVRTVELGTGTLVAAQTAAINGNAITSDTRVVKFEISDAAAALIGENELLSGNILTVETANITKQNDLHINDYLGFTAKLVLYDGVPCAVMDKVYVVDSYDGSGFSVRVNVDQYDIMYKNAVYSNTLVYGTDHNSVFVDAAEGDLGTYGRILICDVGSDGLKTPNSPVRYSDDTANGIKADVCRFIPFNRVSAVYGFDMKFNGANNAFKGVMRNDILTMFYVPYYSQYYEAIVPHPAITLKADLPNDCQLVQLSANTSKLNGIYLGNGVTNGITDATTANRKPLESFSTLRYTQATDIYVAVNGNFVSGQVHIGNTTVIGNAIFVTVGDAVRQASGKAVLNGTGDGTVVLGDVTLPVGFNKMGAAVNGWYYGMEDAAAAITANLGVEVEYMTVDGRVVYLAEYVYVAPITDPRTLDHLILAVDTNKNDVVLNDDGTITVPAYNLDTFEMNTVVIDKFDGVSVGALVQQFGLSASVQIIFGSDVIDINNMSELVAALITAYENPYAGFNGSMVYGVVAQLSESDGVYSVSAKDIYKLKSVVLGQSAGNNLADTNVLVNLEFVKYSENAISRSKYFVGAFDALRSTASGMPLYDFASEYLVVNSDTKITVIGKDGIKSMTGTVPATGDFIILFELNNAVVLSLSTEEIVIVNFSAYCDDVVNITNNPTVSDGGGWYTLTWNTDYIGMSAKVVEADAYYNYEFENMLNLDTMEIETVVISSLIYYPDPAIAFFGDKWISGNGNSTVMDSTTVNSNGKPNTTANKTMYDVYYIGKNLGDGIKKSSIYSWGLVHGWDVGVVRNIVAGDPNNLQIENYHLAAVDGVGYTVSDGDANKDIDVVVSYSMILMNQSANSIRDEFLSMSYDGNAGYGKKILANANDGGATELVLYKVDENGICTLFANFCDSINAKTAVITDTMAGRIGYIEEPQPFEPAEVNGGWYTLTWKTKYVSTTTQVVDDITYFIYEFENMLNLDTMEKENVVISSTVYYTDPAIDIFGGKWISGNGSSTVMDSTTINSSTKKPKTTANQKMYDVYFVGSEPGDGIVRSSIYSWGIARGWNVGVVKSIVQPATTIYVAADPHTLVIENAILTCVEGEGYTVDLAGDDTLDVDVVVSYSINVMNQSAASMADEIKSVSYSDTTGYQNKIKTAKELVLYKISDDGVCTVLVNFCDGINANTFEFEDAMFDGNAAHEFANIVNEDALKYPATCTSPAVYYKSCSVCGAIRTDDVFVCGEKLAHDFTAETVKDEALKAAATEYSNALYYKSCSVCETVGTTDVFECETLDVDELFEKYVALCYDNFGEFSSVEEITFERFWSAISYKYRTTYEDYSETDENGGRTFYITFKYDANALKAFAANVLSTEYDFAKVSEWNKEYVNGTSFRTVTYVYDSAAGVITYEIVTNIGGKGGPGEFYYVTNYLGYTEETDGHFVIKYSVDKMKFETDAYVSTANYEVDVVKKLGSYVMLCNKAVSE